MLPSYQPPLPSGSALSRAPQLVTSLPAKPNRRSGWLHAWL